MTAEEERVLELCDMSYEQAAGVVAEFDRLRAELDRHRAVGDELDQLWTDAEIYGLTPGIEEQMRAASDRWRSVRGDAPAAEAGPYDALRAEISAGAADHDRRTGRAAAPTGGQARQLTEQEGGPPNERWPDGGEPK